MIVKKRIQDKKIFLSICDKELIGKTFEEDDLILDLKSSFYGGKELTKNKIRDNIKKAYFISCVGKKSLSFLSDLNLSNSKNIKKIKNIPFSFVLLN